MPLPARNGRYLSSESDPWAGTRVREGELPCSPKTFTYGPSSLGPQLSSHSCDVDMPCRTSAWGLNCLVHRCDLMTTVRLHPLASFHPWNPIKSFTHPFTYPSIHSFIFSLSLSLSAPPSLHLYVLSHRHICPQKDKIYVDSPLSSSLLQIFTKADRSFHAVLKNCIPLQFPPRRSPSWESLEKIHLGVEELCTLRSPIKLCKTGARDLMVCSCYKKAFFGKK
jgi:hypothetical protein